MRVVVISVIVYTGWMEELWLRSIGLPYIGKRLMHVQCNLMELCGNFHKKPVVLIILRICAWPH